METVRTRIPQSSLLNDFKAFALRGNVIDLAIGIVIGAAFGGVVQSFVKDVLMPPIGLLLGGVDFSNLFLVLKSGSAPGPYYTIDQAQKAGAVTLNLGLFINTLISFLIIAFAVFLIVRLLKKLERKEEARPETVRKCPYCLSANDIAATRCAHCTSQLTGAI
ncbi:MAG: large-conductance mechanosensitive channel protein MscL [Syntrophothermus sp.]